MQDAYEPVLWADLNLAVTPFAPGSPVGLERGNDVSLINNDIHDAGHQKSSKHIKHGMLLDKHGGQDDGNTKHKGAYADIFPSGKALAMDNSQMSTDGVIHMDAGPEIGRGVNAVQMRYHPGKNIISRHNGGTKVLSVGPEGGNNKKNSHSGKKKEACSVIFLFVFEKAVKNRYGDICKP